MACRSSVYIRTGVSDDSLGGCQSVLRTILAPRTTRRTRRADIIVTIITLYDGSSLVEMFTEILTERPFTSVENDSEVVAIQQVGGTAAGIGPLGFEPRLPDPKSGVLPLDEGPVTVWRLNLPRWRWDRQTERSLRLAKLRRAQLKREIGPTRLQMPNPKLQIRPTKHQMPHLKREMPQMKLRMPQMKLHLR